jgi:hypothetical protein
LSFFFKETFLAAGAFEVEAPVNFKFDFAVALTDFLEDTFLAAGTIGAVTVDLELDFAVVLTDFVEETFLLLVQLVLSQ